MWLKTKRFFWQSKVVVKKRNQIIKMEDKQEIPFNKLRFLKFKNKRMEFLKPKSENY